jgi:hypothetical protein
MLSAIAPFSWKHQLQSEIKKTLSEKIINN